MKKGSLRGFFKHKHVAEEAKMLIKLIAVDSSHFIRYKCKITQHVSTIVLDNEKLSINEVLEVLIGVGLLTSANKLSPICYNERVKKKSMPRGLLFTW